MKVLFVSSGNSQWGITPIVKAQGESLKKEGVELDYFAIKGKGLLGYLGNLPALRERVESFAPDLVHAHYSLSAITASLGCRKPLIASLMGSDTMISGNLKWIISVFARLKWRAVIVKSKSMLDNIGLRSAEIIPNGVDTGLWQPQDKASSKTKVGFREDHRQVVWLADPKRYSKNIELAQQAVNLINDECMEFKVIQNVPHAEVRDYLNAADVLLLTSRWEGSPNIIKEAMACNCPIVATDVGDIRELFGETEGCYLTSFDPHDVAKKLQTALTFVERHGRTKGRERIMALGLDSATVARKLISIYEQVLAKQQ